MVAVKVGAYELYGGLIMRRTTESGSTHEGDGVLTGMSSWLSLTDLAITAGTAGGASEIDTTGSGFAATQ